MQRSRMGDFLKGFNEAPTSTAIAKMIGITRQAVDQQKRKVLICLIR